MAQGFVLELNNEYVEEFSPLEFSKQICYHVLKSF